jgi:hypothetical protein
VLDHQNKIGGVKYGCIILFLHFKNGMYHNPPIYSYTTLIELIPIATLKELNILERSIEIDKDFLEVEEFCHLVALVYKRRAELLPS